MSSADPQQYSASSWDGAGVQRPEEISDSQQPVAGSYSPTSQSSRMSAVPATIRVSEDEKPASCFKLDLSSICVHAKNEIKEIEKIYAALDNYAIYRSDDEVCVVYANEGELRNRQISNVASIACRHYELDYITKKLPGRKYFLGQIAVALRIALESSEDEETICRATAILDRAISAANEERARIGRRDYLRYALEYGLAIAFVLLIGAVVAMQFSVTNAIAELPAAVGSGALGALFSIAIALRSRTVAPDEDGKANRSDALLRLTVGALSGGALILLLTSKIFAVELGVSTFSPGYFADSWRAVLTFGFLAGFSERLVPDLLERKAPSSQTSAEAAGIAVP